MLGIWSTVLSSSENEFIAHGHRIPLSTTERAYRSRMYVRLRSEIAQCDGAGPSAMAHSRGASPRICPRRRPGTRIRRPQTKASFLRPTRVEPGRARRVARTGNSSVGSLFSPARWAKLRGRLHPNQRDSGSNGHYRRHSKRLISAAPIGALRRKTWVEFPMLMNVHSMAPRLIRLLRPQCRALPGASSYPLWAFGGKS
jgi:hypothetical protein